MFLNLVRDSNNNKVFRKHAKVAPIEFIMITLLIAQHKDKFTSAQLSSAIDQMREYVRVEHVDIRMNNYVAKTMLDFIKGLNPHELKVAVAGQPAASLSGHKRKPEDDIMPKAKKISTHPPGLPSSSANVPLSTPEIPTHPPSSSVAVAYNNSSAPPPERDRLAAVRAARAAAAPPLRSIPPGPDSPSLTPALAPRYSSSNDDPRLKIHPSSNQLEESVMASNMVSSSPESSRLDRNTRAYADDHGQQDRGKDIWDWEREERYRQDHNQRDRGRERSNLGGSIHGTPDGGRVGRGDGLIKR